MALYGLKIDPIGGVEGPTFFFLSYHDVAAFIYFKALKALYCYSS